MSLPKWTDRYGIHHWTILRSSYRKLAWVGFKPITTEFCSNALTDWAIRPLLLLFYYCFFYSQKDLGFAKSYLQFFLEKVINRLFRPIQKNS